jgi:hypothetical protein
VALLAPAGLYLWQVSQLPEFTETGERYVCGMPLLVAALLGSIVSVMLSLAGLAFGARSYQDLPRPRPRARLLELAFVGLPVILVATGLLATLVTSLWA